QYTSVSEVGVFNLDSVCSRLYFHYRETLSRFRAPSIDLLAARDRLDAVIANTRNPPPHCDHTQ
ncbi:hypothetical protein O1L55_40380, partial [Streptomyces albulus]|nr:hypothetical protein [Streptomyces noursei]